MSPGPRAASGRATAQALAASVATVQVHGRNLARARAVARDKSRDTGNPRGALRAGGFFAGLAPVPASGTQELQSLHLPRLDVLINNAAVMAAARARSAEGYDLTWAGQSPPAVPAHQPAAGHALASAPRARDRGGLRAHRRATLDFGDLMNARGFRDGGPLPCRRSKLAGRCCSRTSSPGAWRRTRSTVNALHPGVVEQGPCFAAARCCVRWSAKSVGRLFMLSPRQGARKSGSVVSGDRVRAPR